jgi:hypothetical protein
MPDSNLISRREFNAALGGGAMAKALPHPLPGAPGAPSRNAKSPPQSELCEMTAVELADRLRRRQVSAREVMTAHLAQMERINPRVNAVVTLLRKTRRSS